MRSAITVVVLLAALLALASPAAQAGRSITKWRWTNPVPQGNTLNDVYASSSRDVWAVGYKGAIVHFDGTCLKSVNSPTNLDLYGISGLDSSHIWAVGARGTVLFYDGRSWSSQESGTRNNLNGVCAIESNNVWAVGERATVLKFDGTRCWSAVDTGGLIPDYMPLCCVTASDINHVWVAPSLALDVYFFNSRRWSTQRLPAFTMVRDICAADSTHVWMATGMGGCEACGSNLIFFDGAAWRYSPTGNGMEMYSVAALDRWNVYSVGHEGVYSSIKGNRWISGNVWCETRNPGTWYDLKGIDVLEMGQQVFEVFMVGAGGAFFHMTDSSRSGGITNLCKGENERINDIAFVGVRAWAVGWDGLILYNNGRGWERQETGTHASLAGVYAADESHVWAVGAEGLILFYNGRGWTKQQSGTTSGLLSVTGLGHDRLWAVGHEGTILTYDGRRWTSQNVACDKAITDVTVVSEDCAWAVADTWFPGSRVGGKVFHFNGRSWSRQGESRLSLYTVEAADRNHVWAAGAGGMILDFDGNRWRKRIESSTYGSIYDIAVLNNGVHDAWFCVDNGRVLHLDDNHRFVCEDDGSPSSSKLMGIAVHRGGHDLFAVGDFGNIIYKKF